MKAHYYPRSVKNSPEHLEEDRCISISLNDLSSDEETPKNKGPAKLTFKPIYGLGMNADRLRLLESENEKARSARLAHEAEEEIKKEYKEKVFSEHNYTSRISTQSSFKAKSASFKMSKTIKANKELVNTYDKAIDSFENTCQRVLANEIKRLEDERILQEAIRANAGKEDLDFF